MMMMMLMKLNATNSLQTFLAMSSSTWSKRSRMTAFLVTCADMMDSVGSNFSRSRKFMHF